MPRILLLLPIVALLLAACGGTPVAVAPTPEPPTSAPTDVPATPTDASTPTAEVTPTMEATPTPAALSNEEIAEKLRPATVRVVAKFGETAVDYEGLGAGTGIVYDLENGYVLTNAHVVEGAASVQVAPADSTKMRAARVVGRSQCDDLAVLKISDTSGLEAATLGESSTMKAGAEVVALGYPLSFDLGNDISVNRGSISQLGASLGKFENLLKIDVPINPGNSGGPLVNRKGEVIGVNTLGLAGAQNQNYAIAMSHAKPIIQDLQESLNRHYIGLNLVPNTYADFYGTEEGMAIVGVASGSPASQVGIQQADLLLKMENTSVTSDEDACGILRSRGDGDQIKVQVLRVTTGEVLEGELTMGKVGPADDRTAKLEVISTLAAEAPAEDPAAEEPAAAEATAPAASSDNTGGADTSIVVASGFDSDDGEWPTGDNDDFSGLIVDGRYEMQLKTPEQYLTVSPDKAGNVGDAAISTEIVIEGSPGYGGVMMRYAENGDQRSMYVCWINNEGQYGCAKSVNSEWTVLIEPTSDEIIKRDNVNRITMAVIGSELLFDINDKEVFTVTDDSLTEGAAGFYVENFDQPIKVFYDNMAIVEP